MRRLAMLGTAIALMVLVAAPAASAQDDLGDLLGTTVLNGILTNINLPQINAPDPTTDTTGTTPQSQTQQPKHPPGYYCKGESKRRVRSAKGTPFSRCVAALEKLQKRTVTTPEAACKSLSHKHFRGMKRTPYAVCVAGGRKLLADQQ